MKLKIVLYFFVLILFGIFSYGFIDPNLQLSSFPLFITFQKSLHTLVFEMRPLSSFIFLSFLSVLFIIYIWLLRKEDIHDLSVKKIFPFLIIISGILVLSFPAFTYDIFNYITTAKVTFFHHENPYIVMPVDIPNEPYLTFTRAANKVALYGPVWILITALPHYLGQGNIWLTCIMFKLMNCFWYLGFSYLIFRITRSMRNVIFFALNPLVLIEVLVSGHNDLYMMVFAVLALLLWEKRDVGSKCLAGVLFVASCFVKGATLVLLPLFFIKNVSRDRILLTAYCLLSIVFFLFAPLREELYPWYAIWIVSIAAFMDMRKHSFIIWFTVALTFGLELRHIPYMWMGQYGGVGPVLRTLLTAFPVVGFGIYSVLKRTISNKQKA